MSERADQILSLQKAVEWLMTQRDATASVRWMPGSPYGTGNKIHLCKLCFSIDLKYCSHNSRLSLSYREELEGKRCRLQEDLNQSLTEKDEACG